MTPLEVIAHFRSQVDDEVAPFLWSDDEASKYLVAAQDMLARLTGGIADVTVPSGTEGTTRIADLAVTTGSPYAALSPYILRVRSARLLTAKRDVVMANEADLHQVMIKDYGWSRSFTFDDTVTGNVDYGVLGVREDYVRWYKVPATDDTCQLHIQRLPLPRLVDIFDSLEGLVLEVRAEHHLDLVTWMKHLAYLKQDAETYDKKQSESCEAQFRQYCAQAGGEKQRRRFKPRVVQYGGL